MRVIGNHMFTFEAVTLPADFEERMKTPSVIAMAESIQDIGGVINLPVTRQEDMRLLAGVDRAAAFKLRGEWGFEARVISCTPSEARLIELDENFRRRPHTQAQIDAARAERAEIVNEIAKEKAAVDAFLADNASDPGDGPTEDESGNGEATAGPPEKPKKKRGRKVNEGVRAAAKASGVTPRTIRKSIAKAKGAKAPPAPPPPPIEMHGFPLKNEITEQIRELMQLLTEGDRKLRDVQSLLTRIETLKIPMDPPVLERLRRETQATASAYRDAMPVVCCVYCKCHPILLSECPACGGSGYSRKQQLAHAPKELLVFEMKKAMVSVHSKLKRYADVTEDDVAF